MKRILRLLFTRRIIAGSLLALGVMAVTVVIWNQRQLPLTVWLPDSAKPFYNDSYSAKYGLPASTHVIVTSYGKLIRYDYADDPTSSYPDDGAIYETRVSNKLRSKDCPNLSNKEVLLPSACKKIGDFQGAAVYAMHRSLPSGETEYFVEIRGTLVLAKFGGDGGETLDYIKTFKPLNRFTTSGYLRANAKKVNGIYATEKAEADKAEKASLESYKYLDFSPAVPQTTPTGWKKYGDQVTLDGPDATHPHFVRTEYTADDKKSNITVISGKLSDYTLGSTCSPAYHAAMAKPYCTKVYGQDYYQAVFSTTDDNYQRFLFYPVGDSIVVTDIYATIEDIRKPFYLDNLIKAQDELTLSAKQVDKNAFKGSRYDKVFY